MPEAQFESVEPFIPHAYDELMRSGVAPPGLLLPEHYARVVERFDRMQDCRVMRVTYRSGGFCVTGIMTAPLQREEKRHPLIIFNRGGNREFGRLTVITVLRTLVPLCLKNNAIVLAGNYRGVDGGEGRDEFGGGEVEDVLALLAIGRSMPEWDNIHSMMAGHSRGGMMTALALKHGAQVNAVAISAGISDLKAGARERPEMVEKVYRQIIPGFDGNEEERYRERSALCWPEALRVPVLLMHGDADVRVNVMQSIRLGQAMTKIDHPHALVVFPREDHAFSHNYENALDRMGEWMRVHSPS